MPFHLQFKDCLFALQIPICSNVLYTALSPTGEHKLKQFHLPYSQVFSKAYECVLSFSVRGTGTEENAREGISSPYFSVLFLCFKSKLTFMTEATECANSDLNLKRFTAFDKECMPLQGNTLASCTTAIMLLNLLHGISTVTAWVYISCKAKPLTIFS